VFHSDRVFPRNQAGEFETRPYRNTGECRSWFSAFCKSFFRIYPLLGAMGLVLTRLSRSATLSRRCIGDEAVNGSRGCSLPFVGRYIRVPPATQLTHGQNMTERYTYALKTVMILYDGLFERLSSVFCRYFGLCTFAYGKVPTLRFGLR